MKLFSFLVFVGGIILVYVGTGEQTRNRGREADDQKMQAGSEAHFHGLDTYLWDVGVTVLFCNKL